ncbi:MarR family winged helix-turn-helix transcriptional regulator [Bacillus sp. NPDC060175]|uniref:MarR family winged helix-turn-helix transcriptional regulator n=1 Tax=Bacillus sp. NPDC060175 TaxID=3347061 RepID=UPI00364BFB65
MNDTENVIQTNAKYHELDEKANTIYKFVMTYNDYIKTARDYGTGEIITMVEVHTLTVIEESPGITVTDVALGWNRTKGAVSQIITKLEKRSLVIRKKEAGNAKTVHLYVTDKGNLLSKAHKDYDIKELTGADKTLRKSFTTEEINVFYKVMQKYTELLDMPHIE